MICPHCEEETKTKVIDSRPHDATKSVCRRRECKKCGKRFTTYELRACDLSWEGDYDE